jgi:hypothetical protein
VPVLDLAAPDRAAEEARYVVEVEAWAAAAREGRVCGCTRFQLRGEPWPPTPLEARLAGYPGDVDLEAAP